MVGTPTGKLLRVTDTYTHRGYRWRLFWGTSIRQRLSVATAPESAGAACPFDTGPPTRSNYPLLREEAGSRERLHPPN